MPPLLFAMPNGKLPAFNDSGSGGSIRQSVHYEYGYAHYRDPRYLKVLSKSNRKSWNALLYGQSLLPAETLNVPAESRDFSLQRDRRHAFRAWVTIPSTWH